VVIAIGIIHIKFQHGHVIQVLFNKSFEIVGESVCEGRAAVVFAHLEILLVHHQSTCLLISVTQIILDVVEISLLILLVEIDLILERFNGCGI